MFEKYLIRDIKSHFRSKKDIHPDTEKVYSPQDVLEIIDKLENHGRCDK